MLQALENVARLSQGTKLSRFFHQPFAYAYAQLYRHLIYGQTKKGKLLTCNTFFDIPMQVLLPAAMDIYLLGGKGHDSELRLAKFIIHTLQEGDTFLDVGAHFGYYSLLASKIVGQTGQVISVEASEAVYAVLQENTSSINNITAIHMACSDKTAPISFYEFPILYSEYNTLHPEQFEGSQWLKKNPARKINVPGKSVDDLVVELGYLPNFVKIDVEGAEYQVIKGMTKTLQTPEQLVLAIEFLADERQNKAHRAASQFLAEHGFQSHIIDANGYVKSIDSKGITKHLQVNHLDSDNIIFTKKTR